MTPLEIQGEIKGETVRDTRRNCQEKKTGKDRQSYPEREDTSERGKIKSERPWGTHERRRKESRKEERKELRKKGRKKKKLPLTPPLPSVKRMY